MDESDESAAATMNRDERAGATAQEQMDAELLELIPTYYPQPMFAPPLSATQVLATLEALETRFHALDQTVQALLCEATTQLVRFSSATQKSHNVASFTLSELTEGLGLDGATAKTEVLASLEALAAVQVVLVDNDPADEGPHGALLRSFSLVWRSTLCYSEADEDYLVTLVLNEEVMPLIRFAAGILRDDAELLPDWLHCDD